MRFWTRPEVREWRLINELKDDVDGRGMVSEGFRSNGIRSSIVSESGGTTRGESKGKERLWIWRAW